MAQGRATPVEAKLPPLEWKRGAGSVPAQGRAIPVDAKLAFLAGNGRGVSAQGRAVPVDAKLPPLRGEKRRGGEAGVPFPLRGERGAWGYPLQELAKGV